MSKALTFSAVEVDNSKDIGGAALGAVVQTGARHVGHLSLPDRSGGGEGEAGAGGGNGSNGSESPHVGCW